MSEETNIDQLVDLTKGEIIVFRLDDPKDKERIEEIREEIKIQCEQNKLREPSIIFIDQYESIINLNEMDLRSYGWYKKEAQTTQAKLISRDGMI